MRIQASNTGGRILYALLKQQKTMASSGRPVRRARRASAGSTGAPRVARRIAVEIQEALGEERLCRRRRRETVGDDVVEPFRALRSEKAQPVHLHRRGARDEYLDATAGRVTVEIDQDVDAVRSYPLRRALGGLGADVDEMLERALDPAAQRAVFIGADRIRMDFEARAVVALPQLGQQMRDRMRAEIGSTRNRSSAAVRRRGRRERARAAGADRDTCRRTGARPSAIRPARAAAPAH